MSSIEVIAKGEKFQHTIYLNDKNLLHRIDGPAIEWISGRKDWYKNGKLHRVDGPAIIFCEGTEKWYLNGKLYRANGPAVYDSDGNLEWLVNGKLHREDGPAIIHSNGHKVYYLDDEWIEPGRYWRKIKKKRFGNFC